MKSFVIALSLTVCSFAWAQPQTTTGVKDSTYALTGCDRLAYAGGVFGSLLHLIHISIDAQGISDVKSGTISQVNPYLYLLKLRREVQAALDSQAAMATDAGCDSRAMSTRGNR